MIKSDLFLLILLLLLIKYANCLPVQTPKPPTQSDVEFDELLNSIDYGAYLTQVMQELQNDEEFNKNINQANNSDSISIALNVVSPHIRSKLDELKRLEILRLNKLQKEADKRKESGYHPLEIPIPPTKSVDISHLDDINPESFNPEDLKRLIDKTTEVFNKIDKKNDETYKLHEMEKEAKKRAEIEKEISDAKLREEAENKWLNEEKSRRSRHKMIHEPASIEQLKSVWKIDDRMNEEFFNPRTFFFMHDVNGDGNLDVAELETLMQRELDKAYDPNDNATDIIERYHEMSRMRRQFLNHVDIDKNHLVSLDEFMTWVKSDEANQDREWKVQEEMEPFYSKEEFDQFYKDYIARHPGLYQPQLHAPTTAPSVKAEPTH